MAEPNNNAKPPPEGEKVVMPEMITLPEEELAQLKKDAAECKDKYLRLLAEMDNMRKRLQKERQEMIQYAIQNVIVEFLAPLDHLENALKFADQASDEVKHWALGFQMILNQFKDVLTNNGVSPFSSEGMIFDPHCHEAVDTLPTNDFPQGTIVTESIKGYKMGGKTIRPARVTVAMPMPREEQAEQNNSNKNDQEK